ncbi:MAG: peroxide stress protein YaaA [Collinsella sp.]
MRFGATNLHAPLRRPAPTPRSSTCQRGVRQAVLPHLAGDATTVTCLFGEGVRNGKPIQRSTASKKARGSMVRWMAENKLEDAAGLTEFNIGYRHAPRSHPAPSCSSTNELSDPPPKLTRSAFSI